MITLPEIWEGIYWLSKLLFIKFPIWLFKRGRCFVFGHKEWGKKEIYPHIGQYVRDRHEREFIRCNYCGSKRWVGEWEKVYPKPPSPPPKK